MRTRTGLLALATMAARTARGSNLLARTGDFCLINSSVVPLGWSLCSAWVMEKGENYLPTVGSEHRGNQDGRALGSSSADIYASARLGLPLSRLQARWKDEEAMEKRYGPAALSLLRERGPSGAILDNDFDSRLEYYLGNSARRRAQGSRAGGASGGGARGGCASWPLGPPRSLPAVVSLWELGEDGDGRVCFFEEDGGGHFRVLPATMDFARWLELYRRHSPSPSPLRFLVHGGDAQQDASCPLLSKARLVTARKHALLPVQTFRHSSPVRLVDSNDRAWEEKQPVAIWRGATTGGPHNGDRFVLVSRYSSLDGSVGEEEEGLIDVGFTRLASSKQWRRELVSAFRVDRGEVESGNEDDESEEDEPVPKRWMRAPMSMAQQLANKFIIVIEGNDVGSSLRWALYSKSCVIMPHPVRYETWFAEGKLQPWVHFLPVNHDLSDLEVVLRWARENDAEAKAVAERGRAYARAFFSSPLRETALALAVMHGYATGVRIESAKCSRVVESSIENGNIVDETSDADLRTLFSTEKLELLQCPQTREGSQTLRRLEEALRQAREGRFPGLPSNESEFAAALISWRERRRASGWDTASYFARIRELWISGGTELRGVHMAAVRDHLGPRFARIVELV